MIEQDRSAHAEMGIRPRAQEEIEKIYTGETGRGF
jgi:hypothetical protein